MNINQSPFLSWYVTLEIISIEIDTVSSARYSLTNIFFLKPEFCINKAGKLTLWKTEFYFDIFKGYCAQQVDKNVKITTHISES